MSLSIKQSVTKQVLTFATVRVGSRARPAAAGPARRLAVDGFISVGSFPDALRIDRALPVSAPGLSTPVR